MKEAINSPYANLIFRETFRDEATVRRNGGTPTDVTFENGVGGFNGTSGIQYPLTVNGTYSIRIKFKSLTYVKFKYIYDFRLAGGGGTVYCFTSSSNSLTAGGGGTVYVDGGTVNPFTENSKEAVITGVSVSSNLFSIGARYDLSNGLVCDLDLVEIYEGTLTASEVANLYNNTWNSEQNFSGSPKSNLVTNGGFDTDTDWTKGTAGWTISNGKAHCDGEDAVANFSQASNIVGGKKYTCTFTVSNYVSGTLKVYASTTGLLGSITANGTYSLSGYAVGVATTINFLSNTNFIGSIDNVTVQELNPKTLLDFDSTNGVLEERADNILSPTDVTIKKIGQSYSADFNGSTSLIDTGTDMIGTKAVTIMGWVKRYSKGEGNGGAIIDNGKLTLRDVNNALDYLYFTGNGSTGAITSYYLPLNIHMFIAVTRTSSGVTNFYIGYKNIAPALNGSADQGSGTPVAGTTNVIIGNNSAASRTFDGTIPKLKVVEGILSLQDISRFWSSSRREI